MPTKTKKITKKDKKEASKEDITGFPGGFSVNLDKKTKSGDKLRDVLSKHVGETLALTAAEIFTPLCCYYCQDSHFNAVHSPLRENFYPRRTPPYLLSL